MQSQRDNQSSRKKLPPRSTVSFHNKNDTRKRFERTEELQEETKEKLISSSLEESHYKFRIFNSQLHRLHRFWSLKLCVTKSRIIFHFHGSVTANQRPTETLSKKPRITLVYRGLNFSFAVVELNGVADLLSYQSVLER